MYNENDNESIVSNNETDLSDDISYISDDDTYISDSGSYVSNEEESIYYEPEENSLTKYNIILCELYNKNIHGNAENEFLKYNYLVIVRIKKFNNSSIKKYAKLLNDGYRNYHNKSHEIFRNYKNIILKNNYIKPEISQCIYLPNEGHCIAILKTFWVRLIQRKWKNVLIKRKMCLQLRCNPNILKHREIYGRWPNSCLYYPGLKGMLSELSRTFSGPSTTSSSSA